MCNSFNILVSAYLHYSIGEASGRSITVDNNPVVSTCDDFLHCPLTNDIAVTAMVREEEDEIACLVYAVEAVEGCKTTTTCITTHHTHSTLHSSLHSTARCTAHCTA